MDSQRKKLSQRTMVCLFSACVLAALVLVTQDFASAFNGGAARWQDSSGQEPTAGNTKTPSGEKPKVITDAQIPDEDADEGELEPAAVTLDQSGTTPLIQELYQATRLTKEKDILDHLNKVQQLIASGTDIKGTEAQGRTALHWAVFGSSYSVKPSTLIKYEEIADALVSGGVDINKEDVYQDTALDYSLSAEDPGAFGAGVAKSRSGAGPHVELATGRTGVQRSLADGRSDFGDGDLSSVQVWRGHFVPGRRIGCAAGRESEWHDFVCDEGAGQIFATATGAGFFEYFV
jgi:hypothetical protein